MIFGRDAFLAQHAQRMRDNPTPPEALLWEALSQWNGARIRFETQIPVFGYIADFVCRQKNLIIELDGRETHNLTRDTGRDLKFLEEGFRTLRFPNTLILYNLETALNIIIRYCRNKEMDPMRARWQKGHDLFWNFYGPESVWQVDCWLMAISYYLYCGDQEEKMPALREDREELARLLEVCIRRNKNMERESDVCKTLRTRCRRIAGCIGDEPKKIDLSDIVALKEYKREVPSYREHYSIGNCNYLRPIEDNTPDPEYISDEMLLELEEIGPQ